MSDLEAELEKLNSALEEKGAELRYIIKEEKQRKEAELQVETLFFNELFLSGTLYFFNYYLVLVLHIYLLIVFKVSFFYFANNILHLMYIQS